VSLHKYLYANASPGMFVDPSGDFSLGGLSVGQTVNAILTAYTVVDVGISVWNFASSDEPRELGESLKQLGIAFMFAYSGAKAAKIIATKLSKLKKLGRARRLLRGVASDHPGYADATRGIVAGSYLRLLDPRTYFESTAELHNNYEHFNTPFSSWTVRRSIAKRFATKRGRTHGVIITAFIRTFRIFRSPDRFREGEFLVVGPVVGVPTPVGVPRL